MKTTLEISNPVFRHAKSAAANRGIPLREFVTEAECLSVFEFSMSTSGTPSTTAQFEQHRRRPETQFYPMMLGF